MGGESGGEHPHAETAPGPALAAGDGPVPVVGIGASAGGLAAFQEFLRSVPARSGCAYVLVQHLDPAHESQLAPILARSTAMPVAEATDGVTVEADRVYVIPPNTHMELSEDRRLLLRPAPAGQPVRMTIDRFFRSLGAACGEAAVGIVLSGTGSDGTLGIRDIRGAGGGVLAQAPDTAEYDPMPRNAIATGLVDEVLPVAQMPAAVLDYLAHPCVRAQVPEPHGLSDRDLLHGVLARLLSRTHTNFLGYKKATVLRRIGRRMGLRRTPDLAAYATVLDADPDEVDQLARDLLIGVTQFFREPEAFEALRGVMAGAVRAADRGPLRVWVPGCATGEEAYSLVMLLIEEFAAAGREPNLQVFATDIDERALERARTGDYPESIVPDVSPERLARFFVRDGERYRVAKEVRDRLAFAVQNVITDPAFSRMDLISCRNLLIYLEPDIQTRVLSLFHYALAPGGTLFLGKSDGVSGRAELFEPLSKRWRVFRRRATEHANTTALLTATDERRAGRRGRATAASVERPTAAVLPELAQRALLDALSAALVIVDRTGRAHHVQGSAGRYFDFPVGDPALNVVNLARGELASGLRRALPRAAADGETIHLRGVSTQDAAGAGEAGADAAGGRRVDVVVLPLGERRDADRLLAVLLLDSGGAEGRLAPPQSGTAADSKSLVEQLEAELRSTREDLEGSVEELETSNEELRVANEEVMSTNEELQSTNEELETSKEELQSLNEELATVNGQLQEKLEELSDANDDLANLLASTDIATVFLDTRSCIKRFTSPAHRLLNLIPTDVGRPVGHLALNFDGLDLAADVETVLREQRPLEREVQARDGAWYFLRCLLYRAQAGQVDGVVVTFTDITRVKRADAALLDSRARLRATNRTLAAKVAQIERVSAELSGAELRIRSRHARVLHDDIQQILVAVKIQLRQLRKHDGATPEFLAVRRRADELLAQAIESIRALTFDLNPPVLHDRSLGASLEWLAQRFEALHGLAVQVDAPPDTGPLDESVRFLVFDAAREFLFNIVKHAGVQQARVALERTEDRIRLRVVDAGSGFDPDGLGQSTDERVGLLSIRSRAEFLNGDLGIDSSPGGGTRVSLVLPVSGAASPVLAALLRPPKRQARSAFADDPSAPPPVRVLLVDDHSLLRQGLASLLTAEPDLIVAGEAESGEAAIEAARSLRPDVILMDVTMPGLSGVEATRRIVTEDPSVRVLGLSMHESSTMETTMREAGAVGYVTKTSAAELLVARLREVMRIPTSGRPGADGPSPDGVPPDSP